MPQFLVSEGFTMHPALGQTQAELLCHAGSSQQLGDDTRPPNVAPAAGLRPDPVPQASMRLTGSSTASQSPAAPADGVPRRVLQSPESAASAVGAGRGKKSPQKPSRSERWGWLSLAGKVGVKPSAPQPTGPFREVVEQVRGFRAEQLGKPL